MAALSDLHANLPATRAAVDDARRRGAQRFLVAGDLVGDGPHPDEVVSLVRTLRDAVVVRGNVDRFVCRIADKGPRSSPPTKKRENRAWTAACISPKNLAWLGARPSFHAGRIAGRRVLVTHGSPRSDTDRVYPHLTRAGLKRRLGPDRPDAWVMGHTHIPFCRRVAGVLAANCGSAGRPIDGDPRPTYALIDLERGRAPRGRIVRFSYDVEALVKDCRSSGVPGIHAKAYALGLDPKRAVSWRD